MLREENAQQQYADLQHYKQELVHLTRQWDRRVPGNWKEHRYRYYHLESFETFLDLANEPWIEEFFEWVGRYCEENLGLFLDY